MASENQVEEKVSVKLSPPKLYKVLFHNDNVTPMDFVIDLLMTIFKHDETTSKELTLEIHNAGSSVVGMYTYEIAEQKALEATHVSRSNNFPLKISVEAE